MSANFFQDPFGLVTFDRGFEHLAALRPRLGKSHVVHCVDAYQFEQGLQHVPRSGSISTSLGVRAVTIDARFQRICAKLEVPNRRTAARIARLYGVI